MTEARPAAALYDTDGTHLADLPLAAGIQWQEALSAPGTLSLRLPLDDATTAMATSRRILKVGWRGHPRQAARIDSSSTEVAVDGRLWRQWTALPGIMSILGRVTVYPEYGLNRASNATRTFGYPARTGHGLWLDSGNFTPAVGVAWADMTGPRKGHPEGLAHANPMWIAKRGPNFDEPAFSYQYLRRPFSTSTAMDVRILATGDNYVDLWLDGEQIIDSGQQTAVTWRTATEIRQQLPAGLHILAARIRNNRDVAGVANHMGFLFTMQETDSSGNVINQPPIINSDTDWTVSDVLPGFRRAEVLWREWAESSGYGFTACDLITLDFTRIHGSDGVDWDETPGEHTLDIGSSLLDAIAALTESSMDANIDAATLKLQAWNRRGSDKSGTVALTRVADGGNLTSHVVSRVEPTVNTILLQLADGRWVQRQNAAAVAANGREAAGLSVGSTSDTATANQTADAQLVAGSEPTITFATTIDSQISPKIYIDFGLGDTITVPDENATGTYPARVMDITVDASNEGSPRVTPGLMLDRSSTSMTFSNGGAGTADPGETETS